MIEWIDVNVELPPIKDRAVYSDAVLVFYKDKNASFGGFTTAYYYRTLPLVGSELWVGRGCIDLQPTHWAIINIPE